MRAVLQLYISAHEKTQLNRGCFFRFFISSLLPEDIHLTFITIIFSQYLYCIKSVDLNGTVLALLLLFYTFSPDGEERVFTVNQKLPTSECI